MAPRVNDRDDKPLKLTSHRRDIDGLRAVAVLSVIAFHLGAMPRGYLGVDVFFVISGFLITGIIYRNLIANEFSLSGFYLRRIRRIAPLSLLVTSLSLLIGWFVMLPDDLENLAQSVVATNFCSNNVLQAITTKNYWDVVNDYKPLMHTWSLGVEEQYYLLYPLLFWLFGRGRHRLIMPMLLGITVLSLVVFYLPVEPHERFYYLPFRMFELSAGGILAVLLGSKLLASRWSWLCLVGLVLLLAVPALPVSPQLAIVLTVLLTIGVLAADCRHDFVLALILQNPIMVFLGVISYSLYMWHQLVFAFARYAVIPQFSYVSVAAALALILALSIMSYFWVEQPFRQAKRVPTRVLLACVGSCFIGSSAVAMYVYLQGGVVRDVPELDLQAGQSVRGVHARYNHRIHELNRGFSDHSRIPVLVIGNSFARDWVNVLLESEFAQRLEVSYVASPGDTPDFAERLGHAAVVFFSTPSPTDVDRWKIPLDKLYVVGTKNFGMSNGIAYNYRGPSFHAQRTQLEEGYERENRELLATWGEEKYIDLITPIIDNEGSVPVFTPEGKFISQDCRHLTQAGARFYAQLLQDKFVQQFMAIGHPL